MIASNSQYSPPRPVGWLLLAFALSLTANGVAGGYAPYGSWLGPGRCRLPPDWRYQLVDNPLDLRPFDGALLLAYQAALVVTVLGPLLTTEARCATRRNGTGSSGEAISLMRP
jgi:hypothetical protein